MQHMNVLNTLLSKADDLTQLEAQLVEEINKFKELEKNISTQHSELEQLLNLDESVVAPLSSSNSELNISKTKEEKNEECWERAEFERDFKIKCKSDIIEVLKDGLRGIFEIRMEVNKEVNEIRKEIVEAFPMDFNISYQEEFESLEDGAEWIKLDIEKICDNAIQQFELYVDVISK